MNSSSKICRFCAEPVPAEAKVCPRCRQWLTFRSIYHPAYLLWIMTGPVLIGCFVFVFLALGKLEQIQSPHPYYGEVSNAIQVIEAKQVWRQTESGTRLHILGLVTNQSQFPWKDVEFECRFYNTNNVLIDVTHPNSYFTLQPNDNAAFEFLIRPNRTKSDYSSFKLKIVTARVATSL